VLFAELLQVREGRHVERLPPVLHAMAFPSSPAAFHRPHRVNGRPVAAFHGEEVADRGKNARRRTRGTEWTPRCVGRMTIPSSSMVAQKISTCS